MMSKPAEFPANHMSSRFGTVHRECRTRGADLIVTGWSDKASSLLVHTKCKSIYIMLNKNNSCFQRQPILTRLWHQVYKVPRNMLKRG